jgi:hypothetical protein
MFATMARGAVRVFERRAAVGIDLALLDSGATTPGREAGRRRL